VHQDVLHYVVSLAAQIHPEFDERDSLAAVRTHPVATRRVMTSRRPGTVGRDRRYQMSTCQYGSLVGDLLSVLLGRCPRTPSQGGWVRASVTNRSSTSGVGRCRRRRRPARTRSAYPWVPRQQAAARPAFVRFQCSRCESGMDRERRALMRSVGFCLVNPPRSLPGLVRFRLWCSSRTVRTSRRVHRSVCRRVRAVRGWGCGCLGDRHRAPRTSHRHRGRRADRRLSVVLQFRRDRFLRGRRSAR